jgi:hypothetical protein
MSFQDNLLKIDCTHLAWGFPPETRELKAEGYLYPGIAILLRAV